MINSYAVLGLGRVGRYVATALVEREFDVIWFDVDGAVAPVEGARRVDNIEELIAGGPVVECLPEDFALKVSALSQLVGAELPVLTTTSAYTVSELAASSGLDDRIAGFHFLASDGGRIAEISAPTPHGPASDAAGELAEALGLEPMAVADLPGRISRRLLVPFMNNVLRAEQLDVASADDIDLVVRLGLGHAVGPLERIRTAGMDDHAAVAALLSSAATIHSQKQASPSDNGSTLQEENDK